MSNEEPILRQIAQGGFHSGQVLADSLKISRASVWNAIQRLTESGIEIYSVRGKGYRLANPLELLESKKIISATGPLLDKIAPKLAVLWQVPSTNGYLMEGAFESGQICLSEMQTAGRGRRGRAWVSPPGGNIYYSQLWQFNHGPATLSGLSLAAAVAVVNTLKRHGANDVQLKWPNDILCKDKKLAGILLEMAGESTGPCKVVVGIGINVQMSDDIGSKINQEWIDLRSIGQKPIQRNLLVATLITEMNNMFNTYMKEGVAPFVPQWREFDAFLNQPIVVTVGSTVHQGESRGIDQQGNLLLQQGDNIRRFASGEVSVRRRHATLEEA